MSNIAHISPLCVLSAAYSYALHSTGMTENGFNIFHFVVASMILELIFCLVSISE